MSFANKAVIVTGASSGIGAATAISFAKEKANVVLVGRNQTKLGNVLKTCEENGNKNLVVIADVSNEDDARRIIKTTIDTFGKLDILVNNAGICSLANIDDEILMEVYDRVLNTNLRACVHLTHLAVSHLIETKGNIINISSVAGSMTVMPGMFSYAISKAALNHFTCCIAEELASKGVRVNTISPGPVKTDIMDSLDVPIDLPSLKIPLERISEPEEIAYIVLFLASDKAKGVTGSEFVSDNGMKIAA